MEKIGSTKIGSTKIEEGRWWYYGEGAEGVRWYNMGPADEVTVNHFGYETGITVAEAIASDRLDVHDETGTPRLARL